MYSHYNTPFPPRPLCEKHFCEWRQSQVDPSIISLNVVSLRGNEAADALLYADSLPRRNDGRLVNAYLKRYDHLQHGGWWCSSVDLRNPKGGTRSPWGGLKPNVPVVREEQGKEKIIKYEHPPKVPTEVYALAVSWRISYKIAARGNAGVQASWFKRFQSALLETPEGEPQALLTECERFADLGAKISNDTCATFLDSEDKKFWAWFLETPKLMVILTEGAKKAGAILTAGYVCIALPGVWNGCKKKEEGSGTEYELIDSLKRICHNRTVVFAFDSDTKEKTRNAVTAAIRRTGWLAKENGCEVTVATWKPEDGKGADDLISNLGEEAFYKAVKNAKPLEQLSLVDYSALTYKSNVTLNERHLIDGNKAVTHIPTSEKLVAILSPKDTRKTGLMAHYCEKALWHGQPIIVLSHRVQLAKHLAHRFGIPHISEVRASPTGKVLGYGLCVDSAHPHSQAQFRASDWEDALVIIDEAEQVIWHLLDADTEIEKHRISVLEQLRALIHGVAHSERGQILMADADLSNIGIDFIRELGGIEHIRPWIIRNNYTFQGEKAWQVQQYEEASPYGWYHDLLNHIEQGGKPFIFSSSQKRKGTWGTLNLERLLKLKFPNHRIIRIDQQALGDPNHPAFGCIDRLNEVLGQYDIVVASPSIETGVSIDLLGHFTGVFACSAGNIPVQSFCQALARVRDLVPRYIWARTTGCGIIGNGGKHEKSVLIGMKRKFKAHIMMLKNFDTSGIELFPTFTLACVKTYAKMAARINQQMPRYRDAVVETLAKEGHSITTAPTTLSKAEQGVVREELLTNREESRNEYAGLVEAIEVDYSRIKEIEASRTRTETDGQMLHKHRLQEKYKVPVTKDIVLNDEKGWYSKLKLHYYLSRPELLERRDREILTHKLTEGQGRLFLPDINKRLLGSKVLALTALHLESLLSEPDRIFSQDDADLITLAERADRYRNDIKDCLGISIHRKKRDALPIISIAKQLFETIGIKLVRLKRASTGGRHWLYRLEGIDDGRTEIYKAWDTYYSQ